MMTEAGVGVSGFEGGGKGQGVQAAMEEKKAGE